MTDLRVTQTRKGVSKASLVQEQLREAIVHLQLTPGSRIDKAAICERFGVSRQPVSDALARLAEERLVEVEPQKGTFVARIRLSDVIEAAFVRQALETAIVREIAPAIDPPTLTSLDRNLAYQDAAVNSDDIEGFYTFDLQFHRLLYDRLASQQVVEIIDLSRAPLERVRRLLLPKPGRSRATVDEHRQIVQALGERDPDASAAAMRAHLQSVKVEFQDFARGRPDLFEPGDNSRLEQVNTISRQGVDKQQDNQGD